MQDLHFAKNNICIAARLANLPPSLPSLNNKLSCILVIERTESVSALGNISPASMINLRESHHQWLSKHSVPHILTHVTHLNPMPPVKRTISPSLPFLSPPLPSLSNQQEPPKSERITTCTELNHSHPSKELSKETSMIAGHQSTRKQIHSSLLPSTPLIKPNKKESKTNERRKEEESHLLPPGKKTSTSRHANPRLPKGAGLRYRGRRWV